MSRSLRILAAALLLLSAAGCGPRDREQVQRGEAKQEVVASSSARYEPLGERVRPADPLLAAMRPGLEDWARLWGEVIPSFSLDSLYRLGPEPFRYAYSRALTSIDLKRAGYFGELSPDSTRIAEPSIYWTLEDGMPEIETEPDAASALLDLRSDSLHVFATVGTVGRFDEVFWIDRDRFVVIGRGERISEPWTNGGDLWVYDLGQGTLTRYQTPDMDTKAYQRYGALVDAYLWKRYKLRPRA